MTAITISSPRYELKMALSPCAAGYTSGCIASAADVRSWVRLHPAQWREAYPPRQVNNIYFDSPDYQALNANLSGQGTRKKLRLRWYSPPDGCICDIQGFTHSVLELKCKQGMAGWKETCAVTVPVDLTRPWADLVRAVRATLPPVAQKWLDVFARPVLINSYVRAYYVTPDREVRLTIDTALRACDQRPTTYPNVTRMACIAEQVIVELKSPVEEGAERLSQVLAYFPARLDRFSKYVQGMMAES
ncbi:MAG: VTC domain-containing protein [Anaerolineae bacterium]|nr:VTC domain-containing protein [Anaerolineae bacterium]